MAAERDTDNIEGLRKIYVSPSGSYSIKTDEIFENKDEAVKAIRKLKSIVQAYKERQLSVDTAQSSMS